MWFGLKKRCLLLRHIVTSSHRHIVTVTLKINAKTLDNAYLTIVYLQAVKIMVTHNL